MGDGQCQACRDYPPEFERAVSFGEYEDGLRDLIHLLKYETVPTAAPVLGKHLATAIESLLPSFGSALPLMVPVPLHTSKRSTRGFNQAETIARAAMKSLPAQFEFAPNVLQRTRATRSQVGLDREERIANMHGAFRVVSKDAVRGRTIIVVDDVMTTGTTLSECARVLKKAGAEKVWAATVARAMKGAVTPQAADCGVEEDNEAVEVMASV
jgi:ComF family protein